MSNRNDTDLLNYIEMKDAIQRRDKTLEELHGRETADFKAAATRVVRTMQGDFTGVDIRERCESQGIFPKSVYAWGAFIAGLRRDGLIEETGEWRMTKTARRNPSRSPVYRRVK